MGLRFRKSFKVAPGVKINVGKKSVGLSVGGKGGRVTVNSSGRLTKSASIPGTGISYFETEKIGKSKQSSKRRSNKTDKNINKGSSSENKGIKRKGCLIPLCVFFGLIILIGLIPTTYATNITI